MKRFISTFALAGLFVVNLMSQQHDQLRLPWDTIPRKLPPLSLEGIDTLRFYPGDTIPPPIWEQFRKERERTGVKVLPAPPDNMPVVVPPDHTFHLIVAEPDTTFHYHSRNLWKEEKRSPSRQQLLPCRTKRQKR